ncbi:MAG: hypothetical protein C7B45_01580 [Sulfobacillus acidophilus]|uniref:Zn-ribbon domain-containing OB-fold protein n=1 Tax=Sulfobacillus acidophilus TaxID=53633 RepID=A0A2T2WNC6_9FIRM|nr:MAG: hypothetical protein C7B45_01580 [Sulfobacillus acidophilus]
MANGRRVPVVDHDSQNFWDHLRQGRLSIPRCSACGLYIYYPRSICPRCFSNVLTWVELSGKGTVYSYTVCYRSSDEYWATKLPYVVALIEVENNVRMLSYIDVEPSRMYIGMPVIIRFTPAEGTVFPDFVPISDVFNVE